MFKERTRTTWLKALNILCYDLCKNFADHWSIFVADCELLLNSTIYKYLNKFEYCWYLKIKTIIERVHFKTREAFLFLNIFPRLRQPMVTKAVVLYLSLSLMLRISTYHCWVTSINSTSTTVTIISTAEGRNFHHHLQ